MRNTLAEYLVAAHYPAAARVDLLSCFDALAATPESKPFFDWIAAYEKDKDIDFEEALDAVKDVAKDTAQNSYVVELLFFLCLIPACRHHYENAGLPLALMEESLLDLRYKLEECRLVYGVNGSFVAFWFDRFFKLERFTFGRLQFELIRFEHTYKSGDVELNPDDYIINVHIPRTETPLDRAACREGYRRAADFFADTVKRPVFACCSWLLHPTTIECLSETSNIRRFADDYTVIETRDYEEYSEMWRLYDCQVTAETDYDTLPADTSFRRGFIEQMKKGKPTGWGYGLYIPGVTGESI